MATRKSMKFRAPMAFDPGIPPWRSLLPVLWWTECDVCKREVRWERMWKALTGPWFGGLGRWHAACHTCVPRDATETEAAQRISAAVVPPRPNFIGVTPPPKVKR